MKCKVINTTSGFLEESVNEWLETGKYEIFKVLQTENDKGYITMTIFYYELTELRRKKLEKIEFESFN